MPTKEHWYTKEQMQYIEDSWGSVSINGIAKKLGKSVSAIKQKALHMGLGDARMNFDGITVCQLGKALNREYGVMQAWIKRYGMPVKKKLFCEEARVLVIGYDDFWNWSEQHKELLNFAKMEPNMLGPEPDWVKVKRTADTKRSQRTWQSTNWTPQEDQQLQQLMRTRGITYPKLSVQLNRSESSIRRRIYDLHITIKPVRSKNHKYTAEQLNILMTMAQQGYGYETIGEAIGKSALGVRGKLERMNFVFKQRRFREVAQ